MPKTNDKLTGAMLEGLRSEDDDAIDDAFDKKANSLDEDDYFDLGGDDGDDEEAEPEQPSPKPDLTSKLREASAIMGEKSLVAKDKGTCKPGERADITGCTPASGGGKKKPEGGAGRSLSKHMHDIDQALKKGIKDPAKRKQYMEAATNVFKAMPAKAIERFAENTKSYQFLESTDEVSNYFASVDPEAARIVKGGGAIGGGYNYRDRSFTMDGEPPYPSEAHEAATTQELYAHEFTHAVDGPDHSLSDSEEWFAAGQAELASGQLDRYAASSAVEAFAEFGRCVYSGRYPLEQVEKKFPKCTAFWKKQGIWPDKQPPPMPLPSWATGYDRGPQSNPPPNPHGDI